MFIEQLTLVNFRCFGQNDTVISLKPDLTTFIGANGTGKTAVMQAFQRLFGISDRQRRICRQDFHVPANESIAPAQRTFVLEVVLAFPELDGSGDTMAIPEFFNQMAADQEGHLKCRLRLEATLTEDGSLDGTIEQKYFAVRTFGQFTEDDCIELKSVDRSRIQIVYVPASRDGASQVTAFLRSRLWRAVNWSQGVRDALSVSGSNFNTAFDNEAAVNTVATAVKERWQQVHTAGTDTTPLFRPLDLRFEEFVRKVEVVFHPDEAGRERALEDLSDGQRSLFHLAMTAATLDVEEQIATNPAPVGFQPGLIPLPTLTLIAVEEPENNLAPFYLSRILRQIGELTEGNRAQAVVSSHSASILSRIDPSKIRYFRLDSATRTALVHTIRLPSALEDASKFVREAVRTYPELYFAKFVVLGEGASEEVVLPRLAEAMGLDIDPSFVAVVPLGGRHVNHIWRLLTDLNIPFATLLDLDFGRDGGGWGRIKTVCAQLLEIGTAPDQIFQQPDPAGSSTNLNAFDTFPVDDYTNLNIWVKFLRRHGVFFCEPLDLDYSMLAAFPKAYQVVEPGRRGPSQQGDPRTAVLGEEGRGDLYSAAHDPLLRWYRYLFLGRGKPSTHVRVLSAQTPGDLETGVPVELREILTYIQRCLELHA
jgi:hypothetical protein